MGGESGVIEHHPDDLVNAWAYADAHQEEIEQAILENEAD
jgi:hypothetical protein